MRKSFTTVAVLLLSACFGNAQDKSPIHVVIQATPEQIKKTAMAMFARNGYSVESDTSWQLKISKPLGDEETAAYNTAHWTSPVANCRHVQTFRLARKDEGTEVAMVAEMVCRNDGKWWFFRRDDDQKEIQWAQDILADLKAKIEKTNKRR